MTISAWLRWDVVGGLLPSTPARVLDIGAGTGTIGILLAQMYEYVGVEPDRLSYEAARRRLGPEGTVLNCGFEALEPRHDFDLVCAFEVLEHLEDDAGAIRLWAQHLRPGGALVVSVPKDAHRYGRVNANVGDLRRYDRVELVRLFEDAGLRGVVTRAYGSPYGNVQEVVQNVVLSARPTRKSLAERTASSARSLQPPPALGRVVRAVALPLALAQRSFTARGIGTGLVCRGILPTP